jgi:hypothetical protein
VIDDDFSVHCESANAAVLRGVMRLESVEAYDRVFLPVRAALLAASEAYRIDVRELLFLNSSGIRALCELVLLARNEQRKLEILASRTVPWQRKSLTSLQRIYDGLVLRLD